jgi:hypothetical protein
MVWICGNAISLISYPHRIAALDASGCAPGVSVASRVSLLRGESLVYLIDLLPADRLLASASGVEENPAG